MRQRHGRIVIDRERGGDQVQRHPLGKALGQALQVASDRQVEELDRRFLG
jgi:hypothetical protein